jgi:hypothetical protein
MGLGTSSCMCIKCGSACSDGVRTPNALRMRDCKPYCSHAHARTTATTMSPRSGSTVAPWRSSLCRPTLPCPAPPLADAALTGLLLARACGVSCSSRMRRRSCRRMRVLSCGFCFHGTWAGLPTAPAAAVGAAGGAAAVDAAGACTRPSTRRCCACCRGTRAAGHRMATAWRVRWWMLCSCCAVQSSSCMASCRALTRGLLHGLPPPPVACCC